MHARRAKCSCLGDALCSLASASVHLTTALLSGPLAIAFWPAGQLPGALKHEMYLNA